MNFKIELQSTGFNELKAKVDKAESLFNELKTVLNEISEATINVSLSPLQSSNRCLIPMKGAKEYLDEVFTLISRYRSQSDK